MMRGCDAFPTEDCLFPEINYNVDGIHGDERGNRGYIQMEATL